jgi:RNA recognition motif-containing protein
MKNTWPERLNVTKTPNQNLAFICGHCNRETQNMKKKKNKSTYLPRKVTTPKYYLKWRWSALNLRENSKEYIWEWIMKLIMTCINTWMNSKRKHIKILKLKAQSWQRSQCLLTGVLGILLFLLARPYCECFKVPRRQTWTRGFWCVPDQDVLYVQISCQNCSCRS